MIFGIGIDLIETERVEKQLLRNPRFRDRIYTDREVEYCEKKKNRAQNYAARFAAKEAFLKALGTGWREGLAFRDIEVLNDDRGRPELVLHGRARDALAERGVVGVTLTLTHLKAVAAAVVVLEKG